MIKPPDGLPVHALNLWASLAEPLERMGMLEETDVPLFESLCRTWGRMKEAAEIVDEEGLIVRGGRNQAMAHPAYKVQKESADLFTKTAREMGLTPAIRRALKLDSVPDPDELERLLDAKP